MGRLGAPASWRELIANARREYERSLGDRQRRIVRVLLVLAAVLLVGLVATGISQFFTHPPDPSWFDVEPDTVGAAPNAAERRGASFHGMFSTLTGMLVLIGGGVFAITVAQRLPRVVPLGLSLALAGAFTGHLIRFNAVKPVDGPPTTERGYLQVFDGGNEYILTDLRAYSTGSLVVLTLLHLAILPLLGLVAWHGLRRLSLPDPDDHSAERVGWDVRALSRRPSPPPATQPRVSDHTMWRRPANEGGDEGTNRR